MRQEGGNTAELYKGDGRLKMAESLVEQHPDIVRVTRKWDRWQHHVDYRMFEQNKLIKKDGLNIKKGFNNYGMTLMELTKDEIRNERRLKQ